MLLKILAKTARPLLMSWVLLAPLPLVAQDPPPAPDHITLKDGSILRGKVTGAREGLVSIETDFAGTLQISQDKIAALETAEPVVVQLADETVVSDQPLLVEDEQLLIAGDTSAGESYELADLLLVNPEPWELGQGYKWTGLVSAAMSRERGNTDTDGLFYQLESVWRSLRDRYTLKFNGQKDKTDGDSTADNWSTLGKYDYFIAQPNYVGLQVGAEHDKFTDLDLRYLVGPFIGRQFYEEPVFTLSGELGVSYVNEDFIEAEDDDYGAVNWAINASSNYLGGDSRLYFDNLGIWNMQETSDVVVKTAFGLAFPLLFSLEAAAEVVLDYDSGAQPGVDEWDETYRFRVGYTW